MNAVLSTLIRWILFIFKQPHEVSLSAQRYSGGRKLSDFSKVTWQKTEQASNLEPRTVTLTLPRLSSPQRRERVLWTLFLVDLFLPGAAPCSH